MCNSVIVATWKQDRITNGTMMENKWWVESEQRRRNLAAVWNMRDEVNFRRRKTNHKLIFSLYFLKASGCLRWRFLSDAPERFRALTYNRGVSPRSAALSRYNGLGRWETAAKCEPFADPVAAYGGTVWCVWKEWICWAQDSYKNNALLRHIILIKHGAKNPRGLHLILFT